jgi:hypothetical protein
MCNMLDSVMNADSANDSELYEQLVRSMIKSGNEETISNSQPKHAAIIFKLFFEFARSKVLIFCKDLNSSVFGDPDIIFAAQKAADRGVHIRVITQSPVPQTTPFSQWLEKGAVSGTRISFKKCPNGSVVQKTPANFTVMDEKAYRYEANSQDVKAVACMNNPTLATQLARLFDSIDMGLA